MNPDIKEDWLEALRSGEYEQGRYYLDRSDKQCCLGVLCDVLDAPWTAGTSTRLDVLDAPWAAAASTRLYEGSSALLGPAVLCSAGLSQDEAMILGEMNDKGATFKEIADYIEACL